MTEEKADREERRTDERTERYGDVTYLDPSAPGGVATEGVVVNMSDSGLSIVAKRPIKEGTEVSLKILGLWDAPKNVTPKWCQQTDDGLYRIGLHVED